MTHYLFWAVDVPKIWSICSNAHAKGPLITLKQRDNLWIKIKYGKTVIWALHKINVFTCKLWILNLKIIIAIMKILLNMFLHIFVSKIYWLDYRTSVINHIFSVLTNSFDYLLDMYLLVFYKHIETRSTCCLYPGMPCSSVLRDHSAHQKERVDKCDACLVLMSFIEICHCK